MERRPTFRLRVAMGALAACGVVAAHCAALLLGPDPGADVAGHGMVPHVAGGAHSLGLGIALSLGVVVAVLVGLPMRHVGTPREDSGSARHPYLRVTGLLAILQVLGFVVVYIGESWLLGEHGPPVDQDLSLLFGVVAQLIGALVGAGLLVVVVKMVRFLSRRRRPPDRSHAGSLPRPALTVLPARFGVASGGATLRGPPFGA